MPLWYIPRKRSVKDHRMNRKQICCTVVLTAVVTATGAQQVQTQQQAPPAQPSGTGPEFRSAARRWPGAMDEARARQLYVSNDHADHGRGVDFARQVEQKADDDKRYARSHQRRCRFPEGRLTAAASATSTFRPTCSSRCRSAVRKGTRRSSGSTVASTATGGSRCGRSFARRWNEATW